MTTVANVLVAQSTGPAMTAFVFWLWPKKRLSLRIWVVIAIASLGIASMLIWDAQALTGKHLIGFLIALAIPLAAAFNWNIVERSAAKSGGGVDFIAAVLIGVVLSPLVTFPFSMPFKASSNDFRLLVLLGVVQLGIPCAMCVVAAKHLPAPELSLLTLLEVLFGIKLAVLFTQEKLRVSTAIGGAIVVGVPGVNELNSLRRGQSSQ